ncbi:heat shock protein 12B [Haematococcus lacustris]|uniref:Heat shock protein 12B n=1 Tax=Haematococcus lacustris TaxID=44745 RepID=A0A699Z8A7_HAELA|nr:heat shock protein 12B [Haematococcus lacustris]
MAAPDAAIQLAPRSLVVSLDIGTHGCGFAFATSAGGGPVRMHENWPDAPAPYPKTRSAILYRGRHPVEGAWGYSAIRILNELSAEEKATGNYKLVLNFKLALQDPKHAAKLPVGLSPAQVMADYLKCLRKYTLEQLALEPTLGTALARLENIQWCLTVPAMWTEASKDTMRTAALRAGLIRTADSEALTIILEPEAAALHALEHQAPPLVPGMSVMVLDVGGGTADVTVHNCEQRGGRCVLAESTRAMGGLCGSVFVDNNFSEYYREAVGPAAFDAWASACPSSLQQVMDRWEAVKCSFVDGLLPVEGAANPTGGSIEAFGFEDEGEEAGVGYRVVVPPQLLTRMTQDDRAALHTQGSASDVLLSCNIMRQLFEQPVHEICALAVSQLEAAAQEEGTGPCSMVLLVGGFARSAYLQARVRAALLPTGLAMELVVPPAPHAAVLGGAVVYGRCPELIHARRSRMAYGVRACAPYPDGAPGKFWHNEESAFYSDSVFQVERDEEVMHYFIPLYAHQVQATIPLYATDNNNTQYVDDTDTDMQSLGELQLSLPTNVLACDRVISVTFNFGRTMITASARDEASQQRVQTDFKFARA